MQKKKIFFATYILLIIIFFIIFELTLNIAKYGINTNVFIYIKEINSYVLNKAILNKYYPVSNEVIFDYEKILFKKEKENNVKRGFVVGGSTAAGYPFYSNNSFSKILENSLNYSNKSNYKYEVHNLGFSEMSSYYVADVSKKLLKYKPDFLIIYSGHNEYYGTISESTGGSHISRKIYLKIKEYKIIQMIMNLFLNKKSNKEKKILMELQFDDKYYEYNEKRENKISKNFIKNIDEIVNIYSKKNIPVIIIEPISNICDSSPFKGKNDDLFKDYINKLQEMIQNNSIDLINEFEINHELENHNNANLYYLIGKMKKLKSINYEEDMIKAKDYDTVPFRARSNLINELRNYCEKNKNNSNLYFLKYYEEIKKEHGYEIFSNKIFCDHLHFNDNGNLLLAFHLSKIFTGIHNIDEKKIIEYFVEKSSNVYIDLKYSPISQYIAYSNIEKLINNKLFLNRLVNENYISILRHNNPILKQDEFMKELVNMDVKNMYINYLNYFIKIGKMEEYLKTLNSLEYIYPGYYKIYIFYAQYLIGKKDFNKARRYLSLAYILSNKDIKVKKEILEIYKFNIDKDIKNYLEEIKSIL